MKKKPFSELIAEMRETQKKFLNDHGIVRPTECNHDVDSESTTIKCLPMQSFVFPPHVHGVCCVCKEAFEYELVDNVLVLIKDEDAQANEEVKEEE